MPFSLSRALISVLGGLTFALALASSPAAANEPNYPSKPIRLVVPFPPGGATDTIGREISHWLSSTNGWTIVVENKPGAGGSIGVDLVAKSAGDGYTLLLGQTSNLTIAPLLYSKLPYDPLKDLTPIASIAAAPMVIVVPANSPYATLAEMLEAAKKDPQAIDFASSGNGSLGHLTAQQLQLAADVKMQHIPYKGASQALIDVMNGTVDSYFTSVPSVRDHIREKRLRAIAVTTAARSSEFPDVPTLIELGYGNSEAAAWFGLLAPAGTQENVVSRLSAAVNNVLQQPEVQARLAAEGAEPTGGSPEAFMSLIDTEITRWGTVVRESGARVE